MNDIEQKVLKEWDKEWKKRMSDNLGKGYVKVDKGWIIDLTIQLKDEEIWNYKNNYNILEKIINEIKKIIKCKSNFYSGILADVKKYRQKIAKEIKEKLEQELFGESVYRSSPTFIIRKTDWNDFWKELGVKDVEINLNQKRS